MSRTPDGAFKRDDERIWAHLRTCPKCGDMMSYNCLEQASCDNGHTWYYCHVHLRRIPGSISDYPNSTKIMETYASIGFLETCVCPDQ
jgi:hypothetical protein